MELGLITLLVVGGHIVWDFFKPEKKQTSEEKLGEALTGYLKSIRPKGE
ncbi:MAG: hypothetical protein NW224_08675 [Leptolyngbyaceae cyanobacterium bins.302]|nr:hypothetical protein [Leptolyngbyaceae cyanobacterium bins.302]